MRVFTIYRRDTGKIVGHFTGSKRQLSRNVPDHCEAVSGFFDPKTQKIDPETGTPVEWSPPEDIGRQARQIKQRIASLEAQGARPSRELALDPSNTEARSRLESIEAEIQRLRKALTSRAEPPAS